MILKTKSGYQLVSKHLDKSGHRRNLGRFKTLAQAKKHEREVEYFKHRRSDA